MSSSRRTVQVQGRQLALIALAPLLVGAAAWLELQVPQPSGPAFLFFAFSPAVALCALLGGFRPGALALLLAAMASDYYLLAPGSFFTVSNALEAIALAGFIAAWLPMTLLAERMKRQRRYQEEQRLDAERAAAQADRLEQLTAALAKAMTPSDAIEACLQESAHWLGASGASFLLVNLDSGTLELARAIGYPPQLADRLQSVPLGQAGPFADSVRRRAPVILESRADRFAEYADTVDDLFLEDHEAVAAVPLMSSSGPTAVVRLDFSTQRPFGPDDDAFLAQMATRAAQALERTRQHEFAKRARAEAELLRRRADQEIDERLKIEQALRGSETRYRGLAARTSRLHALTTALSEAVTVAAVGRAVVRRGRVVAGAVAANVSRLVEDGTWLETVHAEPEEETARRSALDEGLCSTEAIRTGVPLFVSSFDELQAKYWKSASAAADGGYVSSAVLPLLVEGSVIGVLSFHFTVPVSFDDEYQALLISVAQHCAQALDRARLYESAQQARDEAEAANRLKDDFLSIVSHELRTPLNSILGWASILQRPGVDPQVTARALHSIRENATRQAKLVDDLLDFSRIVAGHLVLDLQALNLADVLRSAVETMLPVAAANRVALRCPDLSETKVVGDLRRLEQVFLNLLGNALKFTPAGGSVQIGVSSAGGWAEVRVSDTGIGVEPAFLPHVFERFRQADSTATRSHDGLGLGLSIAKQLVEAHHGAIAVESEGRGRGTTFIVRLPSESTVAEPLRNGKTLRRPVPQLMEDEVPVSATLDGIRVLLVDDEPDAREIIAHALTRAGATVYSATGCMEALDMLKRTPIDVLLSDIAMPGEDGYDLIRQVRSSPDRRIATVPAAAVTAHVRPDERRRAVEGGFQEHVPKPVDIAQLTVTVEALVRQRAIEPIA
jgi:K+-sensing histidine kinase KdpD/ActR/RegA family two-component response regulator